MTSAGQRAAAKKFAKEWQGRGYERGESQPFWLSLLRAVFGIAEPEKYISFEDQVHLDHTSFIDATIPATHVLIEQKGLDKDLRKEIRQSDGSFLTPYQQAKRYAAELPYSARPRWIVTCNFASFLVYDMENPSGEPAEILLKDLPQEYHRLSFLIDAESDHLKREMALSMQAGEIVGDLYDAILARYRDPGAESSLKSLNVLCVRLVFCLYAEDAGIFGRKDQFHDYLVQFDAQHLRAALIDLFRTLDTRPEDRDPYLAEDLAAFPYVNGGLFADETIEIPLLDEKIRALLLDRASDDFDWSGISPTIFGAVFESTLNPETRRSGGMHYTSIANIHKVVDPLFLDDLEEEFSRIAELKIPGVRNRQLREFQQKMASLTFLDPACGSGNFLTETYLSLRRLENRCLELINAGQKIWDVGDVIRVSIGQFYGIEINDFAVSVARTALWIAESQMMKATEDIVQLDLDFLPLKSYANIVEGNALRLDWNTVVPKEKLHYIMGNPPFVGARLMTAEQKSDLFAVFRETKNAGNLDYVACWYRIAADMMQGTSIRTALVSTNSITQGEQAALLWKPLFREGFRINFAHRTFRWDSEAKIKAHVHCVIIGFSRMEDTGRLYLENGRQVAVRNINAYLTDGPGILIESRSRPLCGVPEIGIGNQPIDGGHYLFTGPEKEAFLKLEPEAARFFRLWYGADEFINRRPRWCLWLGGCSPAELRRMPECLKRVQTVREFRLASKRASTLKLADTPTRFQTENMPNGTYVVIPEVSSEKRFYIPMGFFTPDIFCSNLVKLIPDATLFHFGVLTSSVHMAWMRAVAGRLESRYRYSKDIVYNNFPWPECTGDASAPGEELRRRIAGTAQGILDARALFPDCSLADLYDDTTMPPELRKAHRENDRAVAKAFGFEFDMPEPEIVAGLLERYRILAENRPEPAPAAR